MIKYCAQQGVESKLRFNDFLSPMISDFECAYVCGKFAYIFGIEPNEVEEEFVITILAVISIISLLFQ